MGRLTRIGGGLALLGCLAAAAPAAAAAQSRERVRERCLTLFSSVDRCSGFALMVEAIAGGVGVAFDGPSPLPGTPSTIGRRVVGPRWALSGRVGLVDAARPATTVLGAEGAASLMTSLQAELAVGVFDGFSPRPTVGGVLAIDVVGSYGVTLLSEDDGFQGNVTGWGYGVRVGVVRESFTLPAVTLTAMRRHLGDVGYREERPTVDTPRFALVDFDELTVTSVRATVGKELMALGLLAGAGWERARGEGAVALEQSLGGGDPVRDGVGFTDAGADRFLVFGGITKTFLVFQLSLEGGFATGYDDVSEPPVDGVGDPYDPTGGSLFGSLGFRLIH